MLVTLQLLNGHNAPHLSMDSTATEDLRHHKKSFWTALTYLRSTG